MSKRRTLSCLLYTQKLYHGAPARVRRIGMGHIAVLNHSDVPDADVSLWCRVIASQLYWQVCPAWGLEPWSLSFYPGEQGSGPLRTLMNIPVDEFRVILFQHGEQAGTLGYHARGPDGRPYGRVFADDCRAYGTVISTTLSHEAAELAVDPLCDQWRRMPDGRETALETCDACEGNSYELTLASGVRAMVSDFLYPNFFKIGCSSQQFDQMGRISSSFAKSPGGYMVVRNTDGAISQEFGETYPEGKKTMRLYELHAASRTARRLSVGSEYTPPERIA